MQYESFGSWFKETTWKKQLQKTNKKTNWVLDDVRELLLILWVQSF